MLIIDPILGSLIASALSGIFGSVATARANRYNSPLQQRKRVRKAGLPLAYMYQGRVNQQSDVPKLSIDPTLGVAQKIGLDQTKKLQEANIKNIDANTVWQELLNQLKKGEVDWNLMTGEAVTDKQGFVSSRNNQQIMLDTEKALKRSEQFIKQNEGRLKEIFANVEEKLYGKDVQVQTRIEEKNKIIQGIKNLVSQDKILGQLYDIRELDRVINQAFSDNLESQEDWEVNLFALLMKFFSNTRL